jgi:hypothetical protein
MKERGMTFRELEEKIRRVDRDRRGLSSSHLVNLAKGRDAPSDRAMTLVAAVFGIERGRFVEARVQALVERTDVRRRSVEEVLAELDRIDRGCLEMHDPSRPSDTAKPGVGPDSCCALCGYQPAKEVGDGAADILLKPHPGPDDRPMLLCANCHVAVHAGLHPAYSGLPGARLQPPPSADEPGPIRRPHRDGWHAEDAAAALRRGPPKVENGPGWVMDGPPVDTSKWPREEFTEEEPPPSDQERPQADRSSSPAPDRSSETR